MLTSLRIHESCHYVTKLFIASCFSFGLSLYLFQVVMMGEITVKVAEGTKVKVFFSGWHMTCVIFTLVYNLKFYILNTPFNTAF